MKAFVDPISVVVGTLIGNFLTIWILFATRDAWLPMVRAMLTHPGIR